MVSGDPKQKYLKTMHNPARLDLLSDWTKPGFTKRNKQAFLKTIPFGNYSQILRPFKEYLRGNLHK